jgi:hypothetical protein
MLKRVIILLAAFFAAAASLGVVEVQAETGAVRVRVVRAGFIVGAGGGDGTLTYRGRVYPFSVGGVGVGMIGASSTDLVGRAYNLRRPSDLAGTYSAVGAGVALAAGGRAVRLQNSRGVVLDLQGMQVGVEASLNLSGINIAMR